MKSLYDIELIDSLEPEIGVGKITSFSINKDYYNVEFEDKFKTFTYKSTNIVPKNKEDKKLFESILKMIHFLGKDYKKIKKNKENSEYIKSLNDCTEKINIDKHIGIYDKDSGIVIRKLNLLFRACDQVLYRTNNVLFFVSDNPSLNVNDIGIFDYFVMKIENKVKLNNYLNQNFDNDLVLYSGKYVDTKSATFYRLLEQVKPAIRNQNCHKIMPFIDHEYSNLLDAIRDNIPHYSLYKWYDMLLDVWSSMDFGE